MKNIITSVGSFAKAKLQATRRVAGIIALIAIIGSSFAACGDGDSGSGGNETAEKVVYTSVDGNGNKYELTITAKSDKAAYEPKTGDLFTLVITFANGVKKTSEGTVAAEVKSESGISLTLSVSGASFSVSVSAVGGDEQAMTEIDGEIPITSSTDGDTASVTAPGVVTSEGGGNNNITPATLADYLATLPANSASNPHNIALKVNNTDEFWALNVALKGAPNKYVSLNLTGSTVTSIGEWIFVECATLVGITIPNNITSIEDGAFFKSGLTSITLPNSITSIGEQAFHFCNNITSITIPNSITSIGLQVFAGCSNLASVTLPNSITSIGRDAFFECVNLTSITIPNSVTSIDEAAFYRCEKITSLSIPNSVTSIGNNAFNSCSSLTSVNIGSGITRISNGAFLSCASLTSVSFGTGVTRIGENAFQSCTSLASIIIPSNVTVIERQAFLLCNGLTNITFGSGVTTIEYQAFSECDNLTSITIPGNIKNIGQWAFGCAKLASVTFQDTIPPNGFHNSAFCGDLWWRFYDTDSANGTPGTYTTANPGWDGGDADWTLQ
jgi:hypothetical protein